MVCKGVPTKPTPRELGPRLEDGEFMDQVRNDAARAQSWAASLSRSAKYDAADSMKSFEDAVAFCSGAGNAFVSAIAIAWRVAQWKGAMRAAAGKQESARTHNTFFSGAKAVVSSAKRVKMD